jgi:hypothetical protein
MASSTIVEPAVTVVDEALTIVELAVTVVDEPLTVPSPPVPFPPQLNEVGGQGLGSALPGDRDQR